MKRFSIIFAALLALVAVSCEKPVDPNLPTITWASNPSFGQVELAPGLDGAVAIAAPGKIDMLTVTLDLGEFSLIANQYIETSSNKGSTSKPAVLDIIDDPQASAFVKGLGMPGGSSLRGKTLANLDLVAILNTLIKGQPVKNNTTFTITINLQDQEKNTATAKSKIHFTSAPAFYWDNNSKFDVVDLNATQIACKIRVNAPGKIKDLTIKLEDGADSKLMTYIKNRTANSGSLIDLINDEKAGSAFKDYFPSGSTASGKVDVVLDFAFMYDLRFDMATSTNIFTIKVVDVNGKEEVTQAKFKR